MFEKISLTSLPTTINPSLMNHRRILIHSILFLTAAFSVLPLRAQVLDPGMLRAEEVFTYLINDDADNLFQTFTPVMQQGLPKEQLKGLWKQLEAQAGKYSGHEVWKQKGQFYTAECHFAATGLLCIIVLEQDGKVSGLRFAPKTAESPVKALPLDVVEDELTLASDTFKLAASLCRPKGKSNVPLIIMVAGSGPQDKDETVGPNKPFRDLAWALAEKGIATLRYDKRTKTYGKEAKIKTVDDEVTTDALNLIAQMKCDRIYLLGHSLGGMLAPRIASKTDRLKGIIFLAAPARQLETVIEEQLAKAVPDTAMRRAAKAQLAGAAPESYWQSLHQYDQTATARQLSLPMLFLQGEKDCQVGMEDLRMWQQALGTKAQYRSFPELTHLFMPGKGTPQDYNEPGDVSKGLVEAIAAFVNPQ